MLLKISITQEEWKDMSIKKFKLEKSEYFYLKEWYTTLIFFRERMENKC